MGGRGCSKVWVFAAASLTAEALAACAAACPPHLSSFGAGTRPAWKKVLLQQVGRALALCFAEDSDAGSRTAARRRLSCCSSSADAARCMLWLFQAGKIGADPTSEQRSHENPASQARYSLLDFGAGLGEGARPTAAMSEQQEQVGAPHPFPAPQQPHLCSLTQIPFTRGKLGTGIPVGGGSPKATHGSSQEETRR